MTKKNVLIPWSPRLSKALDIASARGHRAPSEGVGTLYLLWGLLRVPWCAAANACRHFGIQEAALNLRIDAGESRESRPSGDEQWTGEAQCAIETARKWATQHRCTVITSEYLLLALMRTGGDARAFVADLGVDSEEVCRETLLMHGISDYVEQK